MSKNRAKKFGEYVWISFNTVCNHARISVNAVLVEWLVQKLNW